MLTLLFSMLLLQPAGWRAEADARIERIRKAPIKVTVRNAQGRPAPGVVVKVQMQRHDFCFGTAIAAPMLLSEGDNGDRYRKAFLDNFNCAVFENDLKWPNWERNPEPAARGLRWMREHGIDRVRGHTLVWPSWRWLPPDLKGMTNNPEAIRLRVRHHIAEAGAASRDWVTEWDVLNEPFTNYDLMRVVGDEEPLAWFRAAREALPKARLYLNDFNIVETPNDPLHLRFFEKYLDWLLANNAPLDGIGVQGHFRSDVPVDYMQSVFDRLAVFGKPITITEFDFENKDEALQERFTRDFLTLVYSHPSIDGFLMWGFWEGRHWRPLGAMLRKDWSPKPNFQVWRDLVYRQWWTDAQAATGSEGTAEVRGFLGDYVVEAAGVRKNVRVKQPGATVEITLPATIQ